MAVAVQSSSSTAWASASSITLTKPTGLAVGDLLIVHIGVTSGTVTTPSGWTLVRNDTLSGESLSAYVFSKVADSADVAAANFVFSFSGTITGAGGIYRIDGHSSGAPVFTSAFDDVVDSLTPSFTNTITPVANCLIMLLAVIRQADSNSVVGTYATATSSPTFSEAYDLNSNGGSNSSFVLCGASGTRSQSTATGNSSFTITNGTNPDSVCQILAIAPSKDFSVTETVTATDSFLAGLGINILETITATDTFSSSIARVWAKLSRNVKSWTNQNKD